MDAGPAENPAVTEPTSAVLPPGGLTQVQNCESRKEKTGDVPINLTKYDVGWRRVVRNFSPSYVCSL